MKGVKDVSIGEGAWSEADTVFGRHGRKSLPSPCLRDSYLRHWGS